MSDPNLALMIVAEPGAPWWALGSWRMACQLVAFLATETPAQSAVAVMNEWATGLVPGGPRAAMDQDWPSWLAELREASPESRGWSIEQQAATLSLAWFAEETPSQLVLDLARRLRSQLREAWEHDEYLFALDRLVRR